MEPTEEPVSVRVNWKKQLQQAALSTTRGRAGRSSCYELETTVAAKEVNVDAGKDWLRQEFSRQHGEISPIGPIRSLKQLLHGLSRSKKSL